MNLLTDQLTSALRTFADQSPILVATDFDGVLAPLVDDPLTSRAMPSSLDTLDVLASLPDVTVAIVSGRDLLTLRALTMLPETSPIVLIGSHGAEYSADLQLSGELDVVGRQRLARAHDFLTDVVADHPDARIETKAAGVALHTRGIDTDQAASATAAALRICDVDPGIHALQGKDVIELTVLDVTKGRALQGLAQLAGTAGTLYLGDDVTDEKAFRVLHATDGHVTVKVGEGPTVAHYRVPGPTAVLAVLTTVLGARRPIV